MRGELERLVRMQRRRFAEDKENTASNTTSTGQVAQPPSMQGSAAKIPQSTVDAIKNGPPKEHDKPAKKNPEAHLEKRGEVRETGKLHETSQDSNSVHVLKISGKQDSSASGTEVASSTGQVGKLAVPQDSTEKHIENLSSKEQVMPAVNTFSDPINLPRLSPSTEVAAEDVAVRRTTCGGCNAASKHGCDIASEKLYRQPSNLKRSREESASGTVPKLPKIQAPTSSTPMSGSSVTLNS